MGYYVSIHALDIERCTALSRSIVPQQEVPRPFNIVTEPLGQQHDQRTFPSGSMYLSLLQMYAAEDLLFLSRFVGRACVTVSLKGVDVAADAQL